MARQPFLQAVTRFLNDPQIRSNYGPTTLDRYGRDLRFIGHDLWTLRRQGKISTTQPEGLTWRDICELRLLWRARLTRKGTPIEVETENKRIDVLKAFLGWSKNQCIRTAEDQKIYRRPTPPEKPIQGLSRSQIDMLTSAANSMDDWFGTVARFLVPFLLATGLRPGEVQQLNITDIDTSRWMVWVRKPKGDRKYALPQDVPIDEPAWQAVRDYLGERQAYLNGDEHEALIPLRHWNGAVTRMSGPMLRKIKGKLSDRSGVTFHGLKTFRSVFIQESIDALVAQGYKEMAACERVMEWSRHTKIETVRKHYGRIKKETAFQTIIEARRQARMAEVRVP